MALRSLLGLHKNFEQLQFVETYSEPCQVSKTELFALGIFAKLSILDVWQGSEYASERTCKMFVSLSSDNIRIRTYNEIRII